MHIQSAPHCLWLPMTFVCIFLYSNRTTCSHQVQVSPLCTHGSRLSTKITRIRPLKNSYRCMCWLSSMFFRTLAWVTCMWQKKSICGGTMVSMMPSFLYWQESSLWTSGKGDLSFHASKFGADTKREFLTWFSRAFAKRFLTPSGTFIHNSVATQVCTS